MWEPETQRFHDFWIFATHRSQYLWIWIYQKSQETQHMVSDNIFVWKRGFGKFEKLKIEKERGRPNWNICCGGSTAIGVNDSFVKNGKQHGGILIKSLRPCNILDNPGI